MPEMLSGSLADEAELSDSLNVPGHKLVSHSVFDVISGGAA
jgi:hypothetical protein